MKALGRCCPAMAPGALHNVNALCTAPRTGESLGQNPDQRTQCGALEAWYGSAESSLNRPPRRSAVSCFACSLGQFGAIAASKRSPSTETTHQGLPRRSGQQYITSTGSP